MTARDDVPFTLRGRQLGPAFELVEIRLAPGSRRIHGHAAWTGALVVVEEGSLSVGCASGRTHHFAQGAVIFLWGLDIEWIGNDQSITAVLSIARRSGQGLPAQNDAHGETDIRGTRNSTTPQ